MKQAGVLVLLFIVAIAQATLHPANIPIARAKIQPNGTFELNIQFDILAFILDEDPTVVLDPPMLALLNGPELDLQERLDGAKKRLVEGMRYCGADTASVVNSFKFPTAREIQAQAPESKSPRLPVMWSITFFGHLPKGVAKSSFSFPDVMGTVVLTTEFPYTEPFSEPVEPGKTSGELHIPTIEEVSVLAAAVQNVTPKITENDKNEARVKTEIQKQYDRWSAAYVKHDLPTLLDILGPDYTLKTAGGTVISRAEYEVMLSVRKKKAEDTSSYKTEIMRITLKDGVAALYSRETTNNPRLNEKTGKMEPNIWEHDYIDVWVLSKGKWLLKSTVTQKETQITGG